MSEKSVLTSLMEDYSILMSVYHKDRPDWLYQAARSMLGQSYRPAQFVLVEDGPLTDELERTVASISEECGEDICFNLVKIPQNGGLGPALQEGLKHCSCDLVARMDADDVSLPDRCFLQVSYMSEHKECAALSGTLLEFEGEVPDDFDTCVKKAVPLTGEEIGAYAPERNPMNHPCVMFRKSMVERAGGYQSVPYFEDYDLWLRMIFDQGMNLANLPNPLLLMRTDGMYERRGGKKYAGCILSFRRKMFQKGYIRLGKHLFVTGSRVAVSLLPGSVRKNIYRKALRKR